MIIPQTIEFDPSSLDLHLKWKPIKITWKILNPHRPSPQLHTICLSFEILGMFILRLRIFLKYFELKLGIQKNKFSGAKKKPPPKKKQKKTKVLYNQKGHIDDKINKIIITKSSKEFIKK